MCIFCEIAKKNIPSKIVYEDEYTLAFLDLNPVNDGHTLVIPKKHFDNFFDLDEENAIHLSKTVIKVKNILKEKLGVENMNLINNSGEISGQTVMHLHIHLIPRSINDKFVLAFGNENPPSEEHLIEILQKLIK